MASFVATHDRTSADYKQQWDSLVPKGYRPISVSVYGSPAERRYAAVWVQRPGPAFAGVHGVDHDGFQQFFDTWAAKGYSPTIIAATGPAEAPVFATVMEREGRGVALTRHGLRTGEETDQQTIEFWLAEARRQDWIPRWIAAYGTPQDRRYAIVLDPNPEHTMWSVAGVRGEDAGAYQQRADAQRQQWARPAFVTLTPDGGYLSVFREDSLGDVWVAHHGLTGADYQRSADARMLQGLYPAYVQAGGPADDTRFATLFAGNDKPLPRSFRTTGPAVPSMRGIDEFVEERMRATGTRATAVAVTNQGRLVYARGFTWGEEDYPITKPTSMFRVASCSKPITAIAIFQLVQQGRLSLEDRLADRVSLELPTGTEPDPRFADITIGHLLTHSAGWDGSKFDPDLATAARAWGQASLPLSKERLAGYLVGQPMHYAPGSRYLYSNFGYSMLGLVIESLTGRGYSDAVGEAILDPLGLARPHQTPTRQSDQRPGAVRQQDVGLRVEESEITGPTSGRRPLAPLPYGGEDYALFDSFGGWCMAPVDYAKLLGAFALGNDNPLLDRATVEAMWTVPPISQKEAGFKKPTHGWDTWQESPAVRGFEHSGGMPGVNTRILLRTDGWGYAIFSNGAVPDIYATVAGLPASAWPTHDLFSQFGIPAFAPAVEVSPSAPPTIRPIPKVKAWGRWESLGGDFRPAERVAGGPPPIRIPGSVLDGPSAVMLNNGQIDVYGKGRDNGLWQQWSNLDGGGWSGWFPHDDGAALGSAPCVVSTGPDNRDVYFRGIDGAVYHKHWSGSSWGAYESLGGEIKGAPTVVVFDDGHTDIYARGMDDALWQQWGNPNGGGWSGWFRHDDGTKLGSAPTVVASGPGHRDVYLRGQHDGAVYHKWWLGSWSAYESLGGVIKGAPAAVLLNGDHTEVYAVGQDDALWQQTFKRASGWSGWLRHDDDGILRSSPTVVARSAASRDVLFQGSDGAVHHKRWS